MTVSPFARAAASASTGSSSMTCGMMSPAISTPRRSDDSTMMSAAGSDSSSTTFSMRSEAPIDRRTSMTPVREGLMPTLLRRMLAFGWAAPATIQNAAELMSPGTLTFVA